MFFATLLFHCQDILLESKKEIKRSTGNLLLLNGHHIILFHFNLNHKIIITIKSFKMEKMKFN